MKFQRPTHPKDSLWSCDLFRCESATLRTHWVLVVMDQFTRRVIGFGVHRGAVDGVAICRLLQRAIRGRGLPKYLSSDHDPLYQFHQWQASLRVLEMNEIKTVPHVPLSHPFVQRLMVRFGASTSMGSYSGPLLTSRRRYSIFKITSMATGPTRGWKDACQNRRATDLDHQ